MWTYDILTELSITLKYERILPEIDAKVMLGNYRSIQDFPSFGS